jgi:hypothetical protein
MTNAVLIGGPMDGHQCFVTDLSRIAFAVAREDVVYEPNTAAVRPFKMRNAFYDRTDEKRADRATVYRYVG